MKHEKVAADAQRADREICGLVSQLAWRIQSHVRESASGTGLTATQAVALRELNESMSQRELAERMCCEASNATFVVDKLVEAGLVERTSHPRDRRIKQVVLTPSGVLVRQDLLRQLGADSPLAGLSGTENEILKAALLNALRNHRG